MSFVLAAKLNLGVLVSPITSDSSIVKPSLSFTLKPANLAAFVAP